MDEKRVDEIFKNIFESMTDEQKEAVKKCKTEDEFAKFMDENIELPEELLEEVAGGGRSTGKCRELPKWEWLCKALALRVEVSGLTWFTKYTDAFRVG